MAFKNTVETVGDAALIRSIIDKSITELNCNITTSIRQQAFRGCSALTSVNFPSVTSVGECAFWNCAALTKADFSSAVSFADNAFYGCSNLTALILRSTDQLCTITDTTFASSAIASGTGYIYVHAAMVDQYKASCTAYAAQIRAIEDYSHIIDPYTWDAVAKNVAAGTYASVYKIGDLVPLDMGSEGQINMQIAALDADDLADGSGKAPISWVAKELLATSHRMNPQRVTNDDGSYQEGTGPIGGWAKSEMRVYLNDTIKPLIPEDVCSLIKAVTKYSFSMNTDGNIVPAEMTEDTVWIPSQYEMMGKSGESAGVNYTALFTDNAARIKKKVNSTTASNYWLRSVYSAYDLRCINETGAISFGSGSSYSHGVCLCFCT